MFYTYSTVNQIIQSSILCIPNNIGIFGTIKIIHIAENIYS